MINTLFFDTETTGLKKPDHKFPMPVQLAMKIDDHARTERMVANFMIKPDGWHVTQGAFNVTGIGDVEATAFGTDIITAVEFFLDMVGHCDRIVAHNIAFDKMIMQNATAVYCKRTEQAVFDPFEGKQMICTMHPSTPLVKAPPFRKGSWKWPKLDKECYPHFFGHELEGAHDALADVRGCAALYYELLKLGALEE
jgi:DNA polymerase-3 subunit epsilon